MDRQQISGELPSIYAEIASVLQRSGGFSDRGHFVRFDATSDDFSLAVNGAYIMRVPHGRINSLPLELARSEITEKIALAANGYSESKVSQLLQYVPRADYRLLELPFSEKPQPHFNPYYAYYRIMGMPAHELRVTVEDLPIDAAPETILAKKREIITKICLDNGISEPPNGYGFKRLKREIEVASDPLVQVLKDRVSGDIADVLIDTVAQRYTPDSSQTLQEGVQRIALIFQELYARSKRYGILMPKEQQLFTFFSQLATRIFGEKTDPLQMFIVACPRYGENDDYNTLEEGLSQTASVYLHALPLFTTVLTKNGIPFRGHILINDTEEQMADGSLLERLGLNREEYKTKCRGNVAAVNQAIAEDDRLTDVSASLFSEVFPEFMEITKNLERQLFLLTQDDTDLKLALAKVADTRLTRHTKIMGGICDFSESLYLALHYSAEYMALGYICRLYPELHDNSFILNYNSPNVEQFNSKSLLAKCIQSNSSEQINTIPVFQVKYY